jgi:PEGA domain
MKYTHLPFAVRSTAVLLILALAVSGCAEYVSIKSYPGGAKAYVDGVVIGTTPASTEIPRSQVGLPHTWRVEFRNCDFAEGQLETGIGGGRIVGYIFTLGLVAAAKGPRYYLPVDAILTGGDCEPGQARPAQPSAPGVMIQNIVGDKIPADQYRGLRHLQDAAAGRAPHPGARPVQPQAHLAAGLRAGVAEGRQGIWRLAA